MEKQRAELQRELDDLNDRLEEAGGNVQAQVRSTPRWHEMISVVLWARICGYCNKQRDVARSIRRSVLGTQVSPAKRMNWSRCHFWEEGKIHWQWAYKETLLDGRHLANTTKRFLRSGDATVNQFTLTTCYGCCLFGLKIVIIFSFVSNRPLFITILYTVPPKLHWCGTGTL